MENENTYDKAVIEAMNKCWCCLKVECECDEIYENSKHE